MADAAVVHPADASPQVIVTDQSPNDGGLLVFEAPLTDASVPLFKITTITPNVAASPNVVREPEHRDVVPAAGEVESSSGRPS